MSLAAFAFRWLAPREASSATIRLDDGRAVELRPIGPDAKPLIAEAITRISPESSRRRFFTVRRRFSDRELDELTALDGWNRYAIGACERGLGAGVGRFARIPEDPRAAELAMIVVDALQGAGLGRQLLARLIDAARSRGIERFTGIVLRDNVPMLSMLRRHAPGLALVDAGEHYAIDMPLVRASARIPALASSVIARLAALASARQRGVAGTSA